MSERISWNPTEKEMETAPTIRFICKLGEYALRPWNTSLFTFREEMGMNMFNHIYHVTEQETGLYIPENYLVTKSYKKEYKKMQTYMLETGYPAHLNMTDVTSTDVRIIRSMMAVDLQDYIPEGWE